MNGVLVAHIPAAVDLVRHLVRHLRVFDQHTLSSRDRLWEALEDGLQRLHRLAENAGSDVQRPSGPDWSGERRAVDVGADAEGCGARPVAPSESSEQERLSTAGMSAALALACLVDEGYKPLRLPCMWTCAHCGWSHGTGVVVAGFTHPGGWVQRRCNACGMREALRS